MDDQPQDGITAYHGSPYEFEQFDTSKIGTGEGAQAYGHGLYFAESEPVAEEYRENTTRSKNIRDFTKHRISGLNAEDFEPQMKGHMYEVHIDAHPDHFLDWDKPLSEQSPHIQKALNIIENHPDWTNGFKSELKRARSTKYFDGNDLYAELIKAKEAPEISKMLHDSGIQGIKYLDASSRKEGEGSRNYVVFDHNRVKVKRRYEQGGEVEQAAPVAPIFPKVAKNPQKLHDFQVVEHALAKVAAPSPALNPTLMAAKRGRPF